MQMIIIFYKDQQVELDVDFDTLNEWLDENSISYIKGRYPKFTVTIDPFQRINKSSTDILSFKLVNEEEFVAAKLRWV